jgi:tRNA threonylcarbamoyladenosine biosynthesis protein TsaB
MIILTIRTDKTEAEMGLYDNERQIAYEEWQAHRQLAETIHLKIKEILNKSSLSLEDIQGVVCFKGPGSFTGLRIGLTVGNALVYALKIPIVARPDLNWLENGIKDLLAGKNDKVALPEYGSEAKTTKQRK